MTAADVIRTLEKSADPKRAASSAWFFKTGKGEYGHGDVFIGVTVPDQRKVARAHRDLPLSEIAKLLASKVHEHRLTALLILVGRYAKGSEAEKARIARFYLAKRRHVDNWDLVDSSAPYILGRHLLHRSRAALYRLARSKRLWDRRIAIVATFAFIREGELEETLKIAEILVDDSHDLIHKAVGWALREVGNRSLAAEERFLKKHAATMPRTMLRYAIEKFPAWKRREYLHMKRLG